MIMNPTHPQTIPTLTIFIFLMLQNLRNLIIYHISIQTLVFPIENIDKLAEFDYNKTVFVSIFSYIPPPPPPHTLKHTIQKTIYSIQKYSFRSASNPKPTQLQLQLQPPRNKTTHYAYVYDDILYRKTRRRPGIRCGHTWNASRTPPKSTRRTVWQLRKQTWAWALAIIISWQQQQQLQHQQHRQQQQQQQQLHVEQCRENAYCFRIRRPPWKVPCTRNRCTSGPIW